MRPILPFVPVMRSVLAGAVLALVSSGTVGAQQDTTPPVLLDFTISPIAFDTGLGSVTVSYCASASDDLSGVEGIGVDYCEALGGGNYGCRDVGSRIFGSSGCGTGTFPQYSPYKDYVLRVGIGANAGPGATYAHPDISGGVFPNLCEFGGCTLRNRPASGLPDTDGDGLVDDVDNCPSAANSNQADRDHDSFGDVCDPFPDDRNNEQAQCEADLVECLAGICPGDLAQCQADLATCTTSVTATQTELAQCSSDRAIAESALDECQGQELLQDIDSDGIPDPLDRCTSSAIGQAVDDSGCSQVQFCAQFDAVTRDGSRACKKADWKNDEPLMKPAKEADCAVDRNQSGAEDDTCVPTQG